MLEESEESDEESSSLESDEFVGRKKLSSSRKKVSTKEEAAQEPKKEERIIINPDANTQSNIEDLMECFKQLELQLGESTQRGAPQFMQPVARAGMYRIMCGLQGHGICNCAESKNFLAQGICCLDLNN